MNEQVGKEPATTARLQELLECLYTDYQILIDDPDWRPEDPADWRISQDNVDAIHMLLKELKVLPGDSELSDNRLMPSAEYIKADGMICPSCYNKDLDPDGNVEIDKHGAHQKVRCTSCEATWMETYELTGYSCLESS